jgi:hypothetical protein
MLCLQHYIRRFRSGRLLTANVVARAVAIAVVLTAGPAQADLPAAEVGYDPDQGAFIRTPDRAWELNPYAMVQLQHTSLFEKGDVSSTSFSLHSAKLIFHGHVFHPSLTYHFQTNFGDGKVAAENIYLRWDPDRAFGLLAGQVEVPFNRQHITLEAYQQLIDRSIVDQRFTLQRDIGAAAYAGDRGHRLEATLGVWNGARQNATNDDKSFMGTIRLAYNPWGPILYREADLDNSPAPKLSIAAAGAYNPARVVPDPNGETTSATWHHVAQAVGEVTLRYRGTSLSTEAHVRNYAMDDGKEKFQYGAFGQVGVFVIPHHLELEARFAAIDGKLGAKDAVRELTGGVSWYFHKHRLKVQADTSRLETRDATIDYRVRTQLEFFM